MNRDLVMDASRPAQRTARGIDFHWFLASYPDSVRKMDAVSRRVHAVWAAGEYLIGKHGSGSVKIKCPENGRQAKNSSIFFPYQCSFIHPPSISKTFIAVMEQLK